MITRKKAPLPPGAVALVTGASSGIGREIARGLMERGAGKVIVVARREDRLNELAAELGSNAVVHVADLTDEIQVDALIKAHPDVDILINNAGFGWGADFVDQCDETSRLLEMIDLNCRALVQLTAAYLPGMQAKNAGYILNVGSIAGMIPVPSMALYCGTKAFVHNFTEAMRVELRGSGVRVHLLAPGPVETEFFFVAHPGKERPIGGVFLDAARVAGETLDGLFSDQARLIPGLHFRLGFSTLSALPMTVLRPLAWLGSRGVGKWMHSD